MSTTRELHEELIATVARGLGDLARDVTFVGGATIGLYLTDPIAPSPRPTDDVDCIVELQGRAKFYVLEDKLRARGFANSTEPGDPICRFIFAGVKVDVMPSDENILGFSNRWYRDAITTRHEVLVKDVTVFVPHPALLVATKLEAFKDRGRGDYAASHDLEDIVALIDGRVEIEAELTSTSGALREYLAETFAHIVQDDRFVDVANGLLPGGPDNATRTARALKIMGAVAGR